MRRMAGEVKGFFSDSRAKRGILAVRWRPEPAELSAPFWESSAGDRGRGGSAHDAGGVLDRLSQYAHHPGEMP